MNDDLQQFHARNMASDRQYVVARQLLELGQAVAQLRQGAKITRSQLGKLLRVKAQDIAIIEEETPRAPAGLLEAALSVLIQMTKPQATQTSVVSDSIRTVRQLRPLLVAA
jgi:DNA-binding XRE family transcriptional regulator